MPHQHQPPHATLTRAAIAAAILITASGCGIFSGASTNPQDRRDAPTLTAEAQVLLDAGDRELALLLLRDALEIDPTFTPGYMQLGSLAEDLGDLDTAERAYSRAAELTPENFDAQFAHATVLQRLGEIVEAVRAYLRAIEAKPDAPRALTGLASAYLELGEPRQALPHAQAAVAEFERRLQQQNPDDPISLANPDDRLIVARAHAGYASSLSLVGEHRLAIQQYERASELFDQPPASLFINWSNSLGVLGRYEEMINTARFVIDTIGEDANAYERIAFAQFRLGQLDDAAENFRNAIDLDPSLPAALNGLAVVLLNRYIDQGENPNEQLRRSAVSLMRRSLMIDPTQQRITELVSRFDRG